VASLTLRNALVAGELGTVLAAAMVVPWWRPQSYYDEPGRGTKARDGGGVLLTQAIHMLDLFRLLVGVSRVEAAQATTTAAHHMETEDLVSALLRLGNGVPGTLMATTAAYPGLPERIEVWGSKGSALLVGGALQLSWTAGGAEAIEAEGGTGGGANIMDFPNDAHQALLADFVEAVETGRDPVVTKEALASQHLVDEVLRAAQREMIKG
jgi:predicted dehydrogenase